jgi:oligopeptide/dipeptide ABC transporter ATP-binding protein
VRAARPIAAASANGQASSAAPAARAGDLLRVEQLRTSFYTYEGVVYAVDGVDLVVPDGGALGLVGESGSGKSVTALSVMGLIDPPGQVEEGSRIVFDGVELTALDEKARSKIRGKQISMIFQDPMSSLNPVFSVGDQIAEAIRIHTGATKRGARDRAVEMLHVVGIPSAASRVDDYPHQFSGGMRQRVMIAMALSCQPKLLIADEPTTALDVTVQAQILELIAELKEQFGMALLLITHDFAVVAQVAEMVAVMYGGRIVEQGLVDEVLGQPLHPYTRALLRSVPRFGMTYKNPLQAIPGSVPSPMAWPQGCRFAPRCDAAFDRCDTDDPPLLRSGERAVACWLHETASRPTAAAEAPPT